VDSFVVDVLRIAMPAFQQKELLKLRLVCRRLSDLASAHVSRVNISRSKYHKLPDVVQRFPAIRHLHVGYASAIFHFPNGSIVGTEA